MRELTLEARPGLTVILGPNGAGKTTLLKAISGLIPRTGKLILDGADGRLRFVMVKPGDVPTFVEYGAADLGIAGLDVVREA